MYKYLAIQLSLGIATLLLFGPHGARASEPPITALAVLDDERVLVASNAGMRIIRLSDQETEHLFPQTPSMIHKIKVANKRILAVGGEPDESAWARLFRQVEMPDREHDFLAFPIAKIDQFADCIFDAALAPDGRRILLVSLDGQARIEPIDGDGESVVFRGHSAGVTGAVWLDSNTVATSSRDASIRVWNANNGDLVRTLAQHTGEVMHLRRSPNGELSNDQRPLVASAGLDKTIRFWQPTIGRLVRFCRLEGQSANCLAWTLEGESLVVGTTAGRLLWIDPQTAKIEDAQQVSDDWVTAIAVGRSNNVHYGTADGKVGSCLTRLR